MNFDFSSVGHNRSASYPGLTFCGFIRSSNRDIGLSAFGQTPPRVLCEPYRGLHPSMPVKHCRTTVPRTTSSTVHRLPVHCNKAASQFTVLYFSVLHCMNRTSTFKMHASVYLLCNCILWHFVTGCNTFIFLS